MGTILPESLEREIAALTTDEKRALATMLRRMVAEETSPGGTPGECPLCHHDRVVKKGHGKDGTQRWKCKGCGRTFGESTMRVLLQSKLGRDTWLAYAEGMADGASLRELARRCGVCLKTSWFMRMRLCEAMGAHLDAFLSGPGVATRRLQRYLDWFCWTEQFRHGAADERELVSREALSGGYETTIREILNESRFQMEYWEERGWSSA